MSAQSVCGVLWRSDGLHVQAGTSHVEQNHRRRGREQKKKTDSLSASLSLSLPSFKTAMRDQLLFCIVILFFIQNMAIFGVVLYVRSWVLSVSVGDEEAMLKWLEQHKGRLSLALTTLLTDVVGRLNVLDPETNQLSQMVVDV
jgi:hypothetical protein